MNLDDAIRWLEIKRDDKGVHLQKVEFDFEESSIVFSARVLGSCRNIKIRATVEQQKVFSDAD